VNILAFVGSPRKGGNTDILIDEILNGSKSKGYTCEKVYLYRQRISPCIDCRRCKKGRLICPIKDGMQDIYPKISEADVILFGTPNYWYGPTGPMKLLFDRMRPFVANGGAKGKKAVIVSPSAEGPRSCASIVKMLRMSFDYLGMKYAGKILVTAYEKGEIKNNSVELKKAYDLGVSLK
jgi:multimeric flavodoxin WrbA